MHSTELRHDRSAKHSRSPRLSAAWAHSVATLFALMSMTAAGAGCQSDSSAEIDPFATKASESSEQSEEDDTELLTVESESDEPEAVNPFPSPPKTYSIQLDGKFDEWERSNFRTFEDSRHVVEGEDFWDGPEDAGLKVAVRSDRGYLYLAVAAADDEVLSSSNETVGDGLVLWLRSPGIASIADLFPGAPGFGLLPELAYLVEPDGSVRPFAPEGSLEEADAGALTARTTQTESGWRAEIALEAGAISQVSNLPTREVAFRVEQYDADDPDHPTYQTRLSILPSSSPSEPRYAIYSDFPSGGWLPYRPVLDQPPRRDTLGRWRLTSDGWRYERFDAPPEEWRRVDDTDPLRAAITRADAFIDVCPASRRDVVVPAGFESTDGQHRAALVLCGEQADSRSACSADARMRMFWTALRRRPDAAESADPSDAWSLEANVELTDEPFDQCIGASSRPTVRRQFTLLPLDPVHPDVWAVGFESVTSGGNELQRARNVWLFHPGRSQRDENADSSPFVARATLDRLDADGSERTTSNSEMYVTPIDDREGWDLCRIETIKEQSCQQFNERCTTKDRGQEVLVHIDMWEPDSRTFTDFMMTKHRRCGPDFQFAKRRAYMLLQHEGRLSLIRSPKLR